jgi:predicted HTH domain antitoxin
MQIEIPDILFTNTSSTKDLLAEIALYLYSKEKISLGKAAEIARLSKIEMQQLAGSRQIPVHYDKEMVIDDIHAIKWYQEHARS